MVSSVKADFSLWDDEEALHKAFLDALTKLDRQTVQQHIDDLRKKESDGVMNGEEKEELRTLLASKGARP